MATFEIRHHENKTDYQLFIDNMLACTLVYIPKGSFMREDGKVVAVNAFCMARFAVTQDLYETVTGKNKSGFQGKQHPVEQVSWYDALRFCGILNNVLKDYKSSKLLKLNNLTDKELDTFVLDPSSPGFRLPTEAEWEYAAKGNKGNYDPANKVFKYSGSDNLDLVGWYEGNNEYETKPVGLKFPNNFGLYDMSGNVWEWCWDWYSAYSNMLINPVGAKSGASRVLRGGSWIDFGAICHSVNRNRYAPDLSINFLGLRVVFVP